MCKHVWNEQIISQEWHFKNQCWKQVIEKTCFFCGKKEREIVHMKDPPKRKLPNFGSHL